MPRKSCITHRANDRLIIIHADYKEICEGDHCRADLLKWSNTGPTFASAPWRKRPPEMKSVREVESSPSNGVYFYMKQEEFVEMLDLYGTRRSECAELACRARLCASAQQSELRLGPHLPIHAQYRTGSGRNQQSSSLIHVVRNDHSEAVNLTDKQCQILTTTIPQRYIHK